MSAPAVHRFDVVDSTQRVAKELARDGCAHGEMVVARAQSAGRGRQGRTWANVEDALLCSVVVRPLAPLRVATRLPLVACARLLDAIAAPLFSKWPNDLMIASDVEAPRIGPFKKVGGVLVEAVELSSDTLACAVIGLGLNVGGVVPADLRDSAGTLADVGFAGDVEALVPLVQAALADVTGGLRDDGFSVVRGQLGARTATLGRRVDVDGAVGVAEAIDTDGALVLRGDEGACVTIRAGDVWLA